MKELLDKRTKTMKVFEKALGESLYRCHSGNIHYPDSSKIWQDIDTTLLTKAGGFYQDKNFYSCEIPDKADGEFVFFNHDHYFNLKLVSVSGVGYKPLLSNPWTKDGQAVEYLNALGDGIHFQVFATRHGLRKQIKFEKPPVDISKDFVIDYEITSMPNRAMVADSLRGPRTSIDIRKGISQAISFEDKIIFLLPDKGRIENSTVISFPFAHDSSPDKLRLPVKIYFYKFGNKFYLRKLIPKEIFKNAVYPIYADDPANYYVGAGNGDGYVYIGYDAWATVRGADCASGCAKDVGGNSIGPSSIVHDNSEYKIARAFIPFDTSGIDDAHTVTAAKLGLYISAVNDDTTNSPQQDWVTLIQTSQANADSLEVGDYDNLTLNGAAKGWDTDIDLDTVATGQFTEFDLNATGLGWISKTADTLLGLRDGYDYSNIVPTAAAGYKFNGIDFDSSETANDPYLDVTASAPAAGLAIPIAMHYQKQLRN